MIKFRECLIDFVFPKTRFGQNEFFCDFQSMSVEWSSKFFVRSRTEILSNYAISKLIDRSRPCCDSKSKNAQKWIFSKVFASTFKVI